MSRSELFQVQLSVHALHRADISHCHQSFPHKMKSEKPAQKFHTDEVSLRSFTIRLCYEANQKHYLDLGNGMSSIEFLQSFLRCPMLFAPLQLSADRNHEFAVLH